MSTQRSTLSARHRFDWSLLLGYDIFISYKRSPAASKYSLNLRNGLSEMGFKCFLDQDETEGGVELTPVLSRALRRSRLLVVLAEGNVVRSAYVPQEIERFRKRRRGRILPVDIGSFLAGGRALSSPFDYLQTVTWLSEAQTAFDAGLPDTDVLQGIRKSFRRLRVASISRAVVWAVIFFLSAAATVAFLQRKSAIYEAEMALAQAYASDLNLAELAHQGRDTPGVLDRLGRYERRLGGRGSPEFGWRYLWGLYYQEKSRLLHESADLGLALSPDGRTIATSVRLNDATGGGVVRVWEASSGRELQKLELPKNHTAGVVTFSPDANTVAAAVEDFDANRHLIMLWEVATGRPLPSLSASGPIFGLEFSNDGHALLGICASGADAPFQFWDRPSGEKRYPKVDQEMETTAPIYSWAAAPGGDAIAIAYGESRDGGAIIGPHVRVWDVRARTAKELFSEEQEPGGSQSVGAVAYSPDGFYLATAHGTAFSSSGYTTSGPGQIRLWDAHSLRLVAKFEGPRQGAYQVTFSPNGQLLASISGKPNGFGQTIQDSQVMLWNVATHTNVPMVNLEPDQTGTVVSIQFSKDNRFLAMGAKDGVVTIFDTTTMSTRQHFRGHTEAITTMGFDVTGHTLVTASQDKSVRQWDINFKTEAPALVLPAASVTAAACSPTEALVAMALQRGTNTMVVLAGCDQLTEAGRILQTPVSLEDLAFSADGRMVAGCGEGRGIVWEVATGAIRQEFQTGESNLRELRLDAGGGILTVANDSRTRTVVRRWNIASLPAEPLPTLELEGSRLLAISEDGVLVASGRDADETLVEIHDLASGRSWSKAYPKLHLQDLTGAAFSRGSRLLALAESGRFRKGGRLIVLDAKTLELSLELPGPPEPIHALAFGAGGQRLVSAGFNESTMAVEPGFSQNFNMAEVRIWDLAAARESVSFAVQSSPINLATLRYQSKLFVNAGDDRVILKELGTLVVHRADTGRFVNASDLGSRKIRSCAFADPDRLLVLTSQSRAYEHTDHVEFWDMQTNAIISTLQDIPPAETWSLAFSPDGGRLAAALEAGSVRVYDTQTGEVLRAIETHSAPIHSLAFSRDGRTLATLDVEQTVKVLDLSSPNPIPASLAAPRTSGEVTSAAISPDATSLASVTADGVLRVNGPFNGEERYSVKLHSDVTYRLVFSASGNRLALIPNVVPSEILVLDSQTGTIQSQLKATNGLLTVGLSDDRLVSPNAGKCVLTEWQLPGGTAEDLSIPHLAGTQTASMICNVLLDPKGERQVVGLADGRLILWTRQRPGRDDELVGHRTRIRSLAFSADGNQLASADSQGRIVLWKTTPGAASSMKSVLRDGDLGFRALGVSPDGKKILTGGKDKTVLLWDAVTGTKQAILLGHTASVTELAFSGNGKFLATASANEVISWDLTSRTKLKRLAGSSPLDLSNDGKLLAATLEANTVAIWRAASGRRQSQITRLAKKPSAMAFGADGETLAVALGTDEVGLWNPYQGTERTTLNGYRGAANSVVGFSPDGRTIATLGKSGTIELWYSLTGRRLFSIPGSDGPFFQVVFSPDGSHLAAAAEGRIQRWDAPTDSSIRARVKPVRSR